MREEKLLKKRLEILRSAAACFKQRGFDGATIEQIAGRLSMTKGSLYYYFKSKEEILYFTQSYSLDRLLEFSRKIHRLRAPADQKLFLLVVAQLRCMLDELQGSSAHIEFHELSPAKLSRIIAKRDRYERQLRRLIEQGRRAGAFNATFDPKLATLAILGAINWTVKWFRPEGPVSADQIAQAFAGFFLRGLAARDTVRVPPAKLFSEAGL